MTDSAIETAAKTLAACMDYPWEHMPEQGREVMRQHAVKVAAPLLAAERERCAKLAEQFVWFEHEKCRPDDGNTFIAKLIRSDTQPKK